MDDNNISSFSNNSNNNKFNPDEDRELFSYDNSSNLSGSDNVSFDLNSFSSKKAGTSPTSPKKNRKPKNLKKSILKGVLTVFLVGIITVSIVVGGFMFYAFTMVDGTMDEDLENSLNYTTTIYVDDGNGGYKEYRRLHGEFNRIWIDYDKVAIDNKDESYNGIPQNLANAFVAIEDKRFFEHEGVDWKRTMGAFINEFLPIYSSRQGGSTITQQLVKNLTDDRSQKASRKVREIMRARFLEGKYSKDIILECYLNTIPMGHGTYGVEVAANYYFGKSVNDLTIAECACLASITKSPSYYAPDDNPENNKERRESVLFQMYDQGYITEEEYNTALKAELKIVADKRVLSQNSVNSYFVDALITEVSEDLAEKYGYDQAHANKLFYTGGYKIYATVDTDIQAAAEKVFSQVDTYGIKGKSGKRMTGGITVMDYQGNVKALVGGIGEKTTNRGFNCATDAVRQPGSTMKPIAAYAPAIEQDMITYSTIVNDTKTNYNGWTPKNWYSSYWGNITVQYALERSVNTIPVYLVNKMTPQTSYDFLTEKLGVKSLNKEDMNLSPLGMGGTNGGLTTLESAAAFAIFGNGGYYYEPSLYTKVTDQKGKVILERKSEPQMAISEDTATVMNHLLQQVVYGSKGTGTAAKSYIPKMKIFAKTGTSNDQNDLWFVGGTPYYVASCWCGYEVMEPIPSRHSGIALKMWGNVMSPVHSKLKAKEFEDSSYASKKYYCTATGDLATDACPSKAIGWYRQSNIPSTCSSHQGKLLATPGSEEDKKTEKPDTESKPQTDGTTSQSQGNQQTESE
ncbi:MAG: transglycosylase domain-containing protein [Clostridia bacterium]|nr:transglycosylase domain-containing protein [Clostridia bacterium]